MGLSESRQSFNSLVGIQFSLHVEFLAAFITLSISSVVNGSKAVDVSSHWEQSWFSINVVGHFAPIFFPFFSILVVKNLLSASDNFFASVKDGKI